MRQTAYLRNRYRLLFSYIGLVTSVIGGVFFLPCLIIIFYPEELAYTLPFILVGSVLSVSGWRLWQTHQPEDDQVMNLPEGAFLVATLWIVCILSGTIPFIWISGLTPVQALFESTSGWTTTGLSVVDVTEAPQIILFYRSFIQFIGGAGLAITALSAIAGPIGYSFSSAEGRTEKLAPHVRSSATIVLSLYGSYAIIGTLALRIAGMSWFDAINHAFCALSTGGFSTKPESIGYWDSPSIEFIIILLMILGTVNFLTAYTVLRGKWRIIYKIGEIRLMGVLMAASTLFLLTGVTSDLYNNLSKSIRVAIFESVSAVSTTGFSTVPYTDWSQFGWLVLITLMLIGGGTGSTAGGIKLHRIYVLYKAIRWQFQRAFLPPNAVNNPKIWHGDHAETLDDAKVSQVSLYIGLYVIFFLVGTGILTSAGYNLDESLFEFASSVGTVGLSIGVTSPDAPIQILLVQIGAMLLGRLEFFVVIVGILKIMRDLPMLTAPTLN